ncbi:heme/hemin ABC transporter substrate-binding protein [Natronospirillum operosum]|nr:ABC transporter substrate-binding protein [Natronospirillum operosum]
MLRTDRRCTGQRLMALCLLLWSGLAGAAERIVVADGALTEILYALGAEDRIVGVDTTSIYPPEAEDLPNIGYLRALSAEGILSLSPDLLLTTQDAGPSAVLNQLRQANLRVEMLEADYSASGTQALIERVGQIVGLEDEAEALGQELRDQVEAARDQIDPDTRILFVLRGGGRGFMVSGSGTRAHALIELTGASNPLAAMDGYKPLANEAALELAPDVILVSHMEGDVAALYEHPALQHTPAARHGRIHSIDDTHWLQFGPRLGEAVTELSELIRNGQGDTAGLSADSRMTP